MTVNLHAVTDFEKGDRGRVTTIAPKSILEFWQDCRRPDPAAYTFR